MSSTGYPTGTGTSGSGTQTATYSVDLSLPPVGSRALLVRALDVTADVPVRAEVTITGEDGYSRDASPPQQGTVLHAPVIGFRWDSTFQVEVALHAIDDDRLVGSETFEVVTTEPPNLFPDSMLLTALPGTGEGGDTLLPARNARADGSDRSTWAILIDEQGEIIWAMESAGIMRDVTLTEDGRLLVVEQADVVVTEWLDEARVSLEPATDLLSYHHQVTTSPTGGFFVLGSASTGVPDFPQSEDLACYPGAPAIVVDDLMIELDASGNELRRWAMSNLLDTHRVGEDSFNQLDGHGFDWVHLNGFDYLPELDTMVISSRHQDAVVFVDLAASAVTGILSNEHGWDPSFLPLRFAPVGNLAWPYHQHASEAEHDASTNTTVVRMFDNGNAQTSPCGVPSGNPIESRVVEYTIDHGTHTISQNWEFRYGSPAVYSSKMGDADLLESGNVVGVWGATQSDGQSVRWADQGYGDDAGLIIEFDPATGEALWGVAIFESDRAETPNGWQVPHAQRLHSLWAY